MSDQRTPSQKSHQIVVGFDFSALSEGALREALGAAAQRTPCELHVVTVAEGGGSLVLLPGAADFVSAEAAQEKVRLRVAQLVDEHRAAGAVVTLERIAIHVLTRIGVIPPGRVLADFAKTVDADLVVVGTHGRTGISRLVLGSVAEQVVRLAESNVLVARPANMVNGQKVPEIEPPLPAGAPHLKQFEHRHTYHYVDKVAHWTDRTLPAS